MATIAGGFTTNNGDTVTASYLNSLLLCSCTVSAAHVLLGNSSASTAQAYQEITLGTSLSFTGTVLNTTQSLITTASPTFAGLTLTSPLSAANGGTGSTSATGTGSVVLSISPTINSPTISGSPTFSSALAVTNGGTGVTTSTGSGNSVLSTSPTLVTPILGTPTSGNLANCTFPTLNQNTSGTAAGLSATLVVGSGGTGSTTAAAANQSLQPATVVYALPGATQTVNWASGSNFYITLNSNLTISFSGATDGQVITVTILNTASNYTVTWPSIKWQGGSAPVMTTGAHYDLYNIVYNSNAGLYFGAYVQNY